ncbi:hypothetical protein IAU60_000192 [Kwoniella sp. DSM 27419]
MASTTNPPKRHTRNRLGERRAAEGASSSRDASEEDNELSDVGSTLSATAETLSTTSTADSPRHRNSGGGQGSTASSMHAGSAHPGTHSQPLTKRALHQKRVEELAEAGSMSEGLDSPTYDGDVESSSTIGGPPIHTANIHRMGPPVSPNRSLHPDLPHPAGHPPHGAHKPPTPKASTTNLTGEEYPSAAGSAPTSDSATAASTSESDYTSHARPSDVPVASSKALAEPKRSQIQPLSAKPSMSSLGPPKMFTRPKELSEADIKGFVERAIHGQGEQDGVERWWKTNPPPEGKVVRVYADGVYDLFHFGHALQLRQAKLSFPRVHLLVGVCSDALCADHKSAPAMTHAERCEAVRHCRWVDEVLPDAPWVVDQAWLDKYDIDYIAHDEVVYPSKDHDDVYAFAKKNGKFVPTRRTPAISTSDLLERIVRGYRDGFFDSKLAKNGHEELMAADVDWDSSASVERRERRRAASVKREKEKDKLH